MDKQKLKARYKQEVSDRRAAGLEGPVQMETMTRPEVQVMYFVELIPSKSIGDTIPALGRMISRIENCHKCKAVYRAHGDRAHELTGERVKTHLGNRGIEVTSTAGYDSNANGRAERAVLFSKKKSELYCLLR